MCAVPAYDLPLIDQSNLLLVWANDSATLVLAFEVRLVVPFQPRDKAALCALICGIAARPMRCQRQPEHNLQATSMTL